MAEYRHKPDNVGARDNQGERGGAAPFDDRAGDARHQQPGINSGHVTTTPATAGSAVIWPVTRRSAPSAKLSS